MVGGGEKNQANANDQKHKTVDLGTETGVNKVDCKKVLQSKQKTGKWPHPKEKNFVGISPCERQGAEGPDVHGTSKLKKSMGKGVVHVHIYTKMCFKRA